MSVYFIGDGTGHVKIGHTSGSTNGDVLLRLDGLQTGSSRKLKILRIIEGAGQPTEKWLHKRYADYRVNGEWFVLNAEMLTVVPPDELPPKPKRRPPQNMDEWVESSYANGGITAQERRDYLTNGTVPVRLDRVSKQIDAEMKAQLDPKQQALYDLYYKM